ncbi:MAG: cytochrome ubiquinol oxidase subunit I [Muribaculaceae bacterium]|nr:cytochrome ubiquinol oxidase subunit I [Muribaculaceae bacterium]
MNDLMSTVDWSRAQFALTAMYHWLFVPLTIGLSVIVAIMETLYLRTGLERWKNITKFWMTVFGINFACGIATGLILEFEFGTNWSNYSWFVGDIFGAPLAIEGLLAFFMEATFVAVMFFGWNKVSPRFHLLSTWLVALGVSLSALWILVANAWMQYPVGMRFDPDQMRNVMDNFWAVTLSPVAMNKFFHAVSSGWALAGVFVAGVSCWMLWKKHNISAARSSLAIGAWVGLIGMLATMFTGHGSAVQVARVQPMKLAAMEGLYRGNVGQNLVAFGILKSDPAATPDDPMLFSVDIPYGLSLLIDMKTDTYVPGINDLIDGRTITASGDTVYGESYDDRILSGKAARDALRGYNAARAMGDTAAADECLEVLENNYASFGYGYLPDAQAAVPPVGTSFYAFHLMVLVGGLLLLVLVVLVFAAKWRTAWLEHKWLHITGMLSIALVWICSQAGWVLAEVGRQPWVIQDIMPTTVAISDIPSSSVQLTFWIFAAIFTALLIAEVSIMLNYINTASKKNLENND